MPFQGSWQKDREVFLALTIQLQGTRCRQKKGPKKVVTILNRVDG